MFFLIIDLPCFNKRQLPTPTLFFITLQKSISSIKGTLLHWALAHPVLIQPSVFARNLFKTCHRFLFYCWHLKAFDQIDFHFFRGDMRHCEANKYPQGTFNLVYVIFQFKDFFFHFCSIYYVQNIALFSLKQARPCNA